MNFTKGIVAAFATVFMFTGVAKAEFAIVPTIGYWDDVRQIKSGGTTLEGKNTHMLMNLGLNYVLPMGLMLGAVYSSSSLTTNSDSGIKYTGYGATVGYKKGGFHIEFSYLLAATGEDEATPKTEMKEGTGMGLGVGYIMMMGKNFGIGPSLRYQTATFTKIEQSGVEIPNVEYTLVDTVPSLDLWITF